MIAERNFSCLCFLKTSLKLCNFLFVYFVAPPKENVVSLGENLAFCKMAWLVHFSRATTRLVVDDIKFCTRGLVWALLCLHWFTQTIVTLAQKLNFPRKVGGNPCWNILIESSSKPTNLKGAPWCWKRKRGWPFSQSGHSFTLSPPCHTSTLSLSLSLLPCKRAIHDNRLLFDTSTRLEQILVGSHCWKIGSNNKSRLFLFA